MKQPNFFIIGAPKSGTTALSAYLSEHPGIFFCNPKEPHFFADDFAGHRPVRTLEAYLGLFAAAGPAHAAVGEGSVFYIYSMTALQNIHAFDPAARIIVMLRNPVDLVQSLHQQYLHALYEDEPSLQQAWRLQEARRAGKHLPRLCRQPELLMYENLGRFSEHLTRLFGVFPKEQVKIILFDDFVADTAGCYQGVLNFLGVPDDGRVSFRKVNEAQTLRPGLASLISRCVPVRLRNLMTALRFVPSLQWIPNLADRFLKVPHPRAQLDETFRGELVECFREDILKLEALLDRDLSAWLRLSAARSG